MKSVWHTMPPPPEGQRGPGDVLPVGVADVEWQPVVCGVGLGAGPSCPQAYPSGLNKVPESRSSKGVVALRGTLFPTPSFVYRYLSNATLRQKGRLNAQLSIWWHFSNSFRFRRGQRRKEKGRPANLPCPTSSLLYPGWRPRYHDCVVVL